MVETIPSIGKNRTFIAYTGENEFSQNQKKTKTKMKATSTESDYD